MFEVGEKVVCVKTRGYGGLSVGKVYTVNSLWDFGIRLVDDKGDLTGMSFECFNPYTETEAEKRGAKFGVTGVVKETGEKCVYLNDSPVFPGKWEIVIEGSFGLCYRKPSSIRPDHEPEFVAWKDAPEHLRYDASRVYFDGNPVKWIAKPEGANIRVVFVCSDGWVRNGGTTLTVKL